MRIFLILSFLILALLTACNCNNEECSACPPGNFIIQFPNNSATGFTDNDLDSMTLIFIQDTRKDSTKLLEHPYYHQRTLRIHNNEDSSYFKYVIRSNKKSYSIKNIFTEREYNGGCCDCGDVVFHRVMVNRKIYELKDRDTLVFNRNW